MAVAFDEGSLRVHGPSASDIRKFDDPSYHSLLGSMKAVDFIVETNDFTIFLELKDPDNPRASNAAKANFAERLRSESLDEDLKYKYRDSFLYEWCSGNIRKPSLYVVVIQFGAFVSVDRMVCRDRLRKKLPARAQAPLGWQQYYLEDVLVMDCAGWNRRFPSFHIERIP